MDNISECGSLIIYKETDDQAPVEVRMDGDSVWMELMQMALLYQTDRSNVLKHIANIFADSELSEAESCRVVQKPQMEGTRLVTRKVKLFNLDMVIAVGYRVKSPIATRFRQWATARLKEYLVKGFTMDDARLKQLGGGNYWHELLDRIRDIRSSEKVLYRQVLDLYATSADYDPCSETSHRFFMRVQNKLPYAAHGHTAAEVVFERADASKPFMGLTTFKGALPILAEVSVAKNYLTEHELKILNNLVSGYFDFAELRAIQHEHVFMRDYVQQLDAILTSTGHELLEGPGKVSHTQARQKAEQEYRQFQERTLSPVEVAYLETIRAAEKTAQNQLRNAQPKKPR